MCSKANYEFYKAHHICVRCGQENAEKNHTLCLCCMMKSREESLIYRNKHREELNKAERIRSKIRYDRLKEQGICACCGKRPTKYNKIYCEHCSARKNAKYRAKYLLNAYASKDMVEIRV